ncbi:MAG: hypothetical protein RIR11_2445 [Bacteroidota bacterium]|jgi:hypothetical protein
MKKILAKIALLFKNLSFLYRLIGIFVAGYLVFGMAIPDIRFNISTGKVIEMTLDQLLKTPADDIPRYLKIKDAVVPSSSYVEIRSGKSNALTTIYYPVYSSDDVTIDIEDLNNTSSNDTLKGVVDSTELIALMKKAYSTDSKLVIHDSHVKDADLGSTGTYFSNPEFTIEGKYDGEKLNGIILNLFKESGLNVSPEAIVLSRGDSGMSTNGAVMLVIFGLLTMLIGVSSFIPEATLRTWL